MSEELRSCPFCGGEASYHEGHHRHWQVVCTACGVRHPFVSVREIDPLPSLVSAWNTRTDFPGITDPAAFVQAARGCVEALEATPLRAKDESGRDFDDRQTAWLRDCYNPAMTAFRAATGDMA